MTLGFYMRPAIPRHCACWSRGAKGKRHPGAVVGELLVGRAAVRSEESLLVGYIIL